MKINIALILILVGIKGLISKCLLPFFTVSQPKAYPISIFHESGTVDQALCLRFSRRYFCESPSQRTQLTLSILHDAIVFQKAKRAKKFCWKLLSKILCRFQLRLKILGEIFSRRQDRRREVAQASPLHSVRSVITVITSNQQPVRLGSHDFKQGLG